VTEPLVIPSPALVVLIGAAGAGKTTLAARLFEPDEILSSDALREAVGGDPADQRATRPAFRILHREVGRRLAAGRVVVVDATNVETGARAGLLGLARAARAPAIAIAILAPAAEVHARNAGRPGRVVPAEVVDRHLDRLDRLGGGPEEVVARLLADGFAAAQVVATLAELDRVAVLRSPEIRRPSAPSLQRSGRSRSRP
jgi:predicted kinase